MFSSVDRAGPSSQRQKDEMSRIIFEKTYYWFEELYDIERDVSEAINVRFNPEMNGISPESQGAMKVIITYEEE